MFFFVCVFFFGTLSGAEARKEADRRSSLDSVWTSVWVTAWTFLWPHDRMLSGLALLLLVCLNMRVQGKLRSQVGAASPPVGSTGTWEPPSLENGASH